MVSFNQPNLDSITSDNNSLGTILEASAKLHAVISLQLQPVPPGAEDISDEEKLRAIRRITDSYHTLFVLAIGSFENQYAMSDETKEWLRRLTNPVDMLMDLESYGQEEGNP